MSESGHSRLPREGGANDESFLKLIRTWLRGLRRAKGGDSVREALEDLIEEREEAEEPIDEQESRLLENILRLRGTTAADVMIPRADIIAVDLRIELPALLKVLAGSNHSRLPVYRGGLDDALGFIHLKDVLSMASGETPYALQKIVRKVLFVSPAVRVLDLLLEMRLKRTHMALIVDEFGGIDGLLTIEDLVEQIVGDIEDEHDRDIEPDYRELPDGVIEADARIPIEELEERVGPLLDEEVRDEVDTLGGLVFYLAGRVPGRGELIAHPSGLEFEVLDADPRRIKRLRVRNLPGPEDRAA